jgi:hypothetical protein
MGKHKHGNEEGAEPRPLAFSNEGVFRSVWERLAEDGRCEAPDGAEYRRVLAAYVIANFPTEVEEFIVHQVGKKAKAKPAPKKGGAE